MKDIHGIKTHMHIHERLSLSTEKPDTNIKISIDSLHTDNRKNKGIKQKARDKTGHKEIKGKFSWD